MVLENLLQPEQQQQQQNTPSRIGLTVFGSPGPAWPGHPAHIHSNTKRLAIMFECKGKGKEEEKKNVGHSLFKPKSGNENERFADERKK